MRLPRLQYSLKTFLLLSALLAFPLGFFAWPFRLWYAEQRAIEQILSQGGAVYDQSQSLKSWDWQALWYRKPGRRFEVRFSGPELAQALANSFSARGHRRLEPPRRPQPCDSLSA